MSNGLVKAEIENLDSPSDKVICMFNPREYTFTKQNSWRENNQKGDNVGQLEFGGGAPARLTLQLLFDTYEAHSDGSRRLNQAGDDVRRYTRPLWDMMRVSDRRRNATSGRGEPPRVRFTWGSLWSFDAVIESITQKFTLFLEDGTPVRATLDVSFKQLADEGQYPRQNPTSGGHPGDRLRTVRAGESLSQIAFEEYGDPTIWRHLAAANQIDDPLRLRAGQVLVIVPPPID
ncbi:MAG: peptidoglycan-binding protein [Chloroflexi bacterium OHK40]